MIYETTNTRSPAKKTIFIILVIILVMLLLAGVFYLMSTTSFQGIKISDDAAFRSETNSFELVEESPFHILGTTLVSKTEATSSVGTREENVVFSSSLSLTELSLIYKRLFTDNGWEYREQNSGMLLIANDGNGRTATVRLTEKENSSLILITYVRP